VLGRFSWMGSGLGVGGRLLVLRLARRRWASRGCIDVLRGRSKGGVPWWSRPSRRGTAGSGSSFWPSTWWWRRRWWRRWSHCGREQQPSGRALRQRPRGGGAASRAAPAERPRASGDPADLDQDPPGAGGSVATAGERRVRGRAVRCARPLAGGLVLQLPELCQVRRGQLQAVWGRCLRGGLGTARWGQGTGRLAGQRWRPRPPDHRVGM
jgi:hypothetical protein